MAAASLPLALTVGAAGTGLADPGQPGLLAQDENSGSDQPGLTVSPEASAPPVVEPEVVEELPVVEQSYLLPSYPQLPARPAPEAYADPTPPIQLQELHAPEPVEPVAPVITTTDMLYFGNTSYPRGVIPEEWAERFNIEATTAAAALETFLNSVGVPAERSQRIATAQIGGGLTAAIVAALAFGIPAAIIGAAVGAAIGAGAGAIIGGTATIGVGAGPAALAGAGIGAIVGAAAFGITAGTIAGIIGGLLGAGAAGALAAGNDVEPPPSTQPSPENPAPMPVPVVELPQPFVDDAEAVIATNAPAVVDAVDSVVTQVKSAPGGQALIQSAEDAFASLPPLPALPPPPAELAPIAAQVGDLITVAHDAIGQR